MDKLINSRALEDAMYHEAFETDTDMQRWDSGCWIRYKLFENVLEGLPEAQPVPAIPLPWIESKIDWLISLDNGFSSLAAGHIRALVNMWKEEQKDGD